MSMFEAQTAVLVFRMARFRAHSSPVTWWGSMRMMTRGPGSLTRRVRLDSPTLPCNQVGAVIAKQLSASYRLPSV
jgi:hypothetical protein